MSTITATVSTTISTIPLLRHRDTVVNFPADQDDFVAKYEATNDHLSISTVPQMNAVGDQIDLVASQMNIVAGEVNDNAITATTKAGEALASANAASLSATNALNSENAAAALLDSFDDRYLGAKTVAPTVDNDGNALLAGAEYLNTSTTPNILYLWDGGLLQWVARNYVPTAHNSLSGLANDDHPQYLTSERLNTAVASKLFFYGGF